MLVTSVIIGILPIKKRLWENAFGFAVLCRNIYGGLRTSRKYCVYLYFGISFFAMLPFANTSIDFLIRTNIDNYVQGRAWAFIGIISQLGFVVSYALSGVLADYVFNPLLLDGGVLADSVGKIIGTGSGRGTGFLIIIAGVLLCVTSVIVYNVKSVKKLENRGELCITE